MGASPGFGGKGADATIVGDGNSVLTITVTDEHGDGIYSYLGNVTIDNCKVVVKGGYTGLFMKSGPDNGTLTVKGDNAVLDLTASNSAMENVQRLVLGETLGITVTLPDFTLHFSCCFPKLLHSIFHPLLNNFTMQEKCY